ncbi:MAG: PIN domain-containing protein [Rhodoferax sp.]|nr:PIN domain-containing protein [Rhodoferax sp.]
MQASLFDTNVWLAAVFPKHLFHQIAQQELVQSTAAQPVVWCRATQQSFVRLASTASLHRAYDAQGLTNRSVLAVLDALQALPQVTWRDEPQGIFGLWRTLAALDSASPKVWMDAYLAAFAIAAGLRMVTLDRDFQTFVSHGLDLLLLNP